MTTKHRDMSNNQAVVNVLSLVTKDPFYYLGLPYMQVASKALGILYQTADNYASSIQDTILKRLATQINTFLLTGETFTMAF